MPPPGTARHSPERLRAPSTAWQLVVLDPRPYALRVGPLLVRSRVRLGPLWTPLVRVRARLPRAADGGGEW